MKKTIIITGMALAMSATGATFHVDASAAAGGDGSLGKPWATARAAVDGVRAARKSGALKKGEHAEVRFRGGDYFVGDGLRLSAADSDVTWRTDDRATGVARLSGGVRVPAEAFKKVEDAATIARLPEDARGKVYVADLNGIVKHPIPAMAKAFGGTPAAPLLFVGGKIGTLARWPNSDYTSFTKAVDHGKLEKMRPDGGNIRKPGAFIYDNPRAKRWNFAAGVWLNGYWTHDWDNHSVLAASYGAENGTNDVIRLAAHIPYGVMGGTWGRKERRFYVFNILEELDAPGEWWIDREKKLLYLYPPKGAPQAADEVTLAFSGNPILKGEGLANFKIEGMRFEYCYGDGAVLIGNSITVKDCVAANLGAGGLAVYGNRNVVRGCEVYNIGRTGINVSGGDRRTITKAETLIEGCHIHDWALFQRTYAPAIGVNGCGITLRRNKMHDAPHSAVLYGGNEHLFEYNEVYRVLMETGDAGAYYTGRDWTTMGNVLRYNVTHDLGAEGDHANTMGFYFDDCDCGDAVYGNIFHNVARGIMVGGGREHPIRNNIFSKCLVGLSIDCRGMTWKHWNSVTSGGQSWLLEEKAKKFDYTNGVWAAKYPLLAKIMQDHPREPLYNPVENNIFIDCSKQILALDGKPATECLPRMAPIRGNLVINSVGTNGVRTARVDKRIENGFRVVNGEPGKPFDAGFVDMANGNFAIKSGAWLTKEMPEFKPLPQTGVDYGDFRIRDQPTPSH